MNYEHIIVDGQSTDGTLDIIRRYEGLYPMRWVSEKDGSMYEAIAKGFNMAKGDIFAWLNSDDMYVPWATQVMERVCNTGVQWCTGIPSTYDEHGMMSISGASRDYLYSHPALKRGWYDGQRLKWIQQESSFWTRELYEKAGGLDTKCRYAGDYRLWCAFARFAPLYTVDTVIGGFRIHAGQKSQSLEAYRAEQNPVSRWATILKRLKFYRFCEKQSTDECHHLHLRKLPPLSADAQ